MGTVGYMAPELLKGAPADESTDAFAFAISLYEGLYGERPTPTARGLELSALSKGTRVPSWLGRIARKGLADTREARYPSVQALLDDLGRDPTPVRRRRLVVAGVLGACVAAGLGIRHVVVQRSELCRGAERALAGVWDEPSRRAMEQLFLREGGPSAAETFEHTRRLLDEYSAAFVRMRTEACEATRISGTQSEDVLSLRMACLDRRLGGLRALTEVLGSGDATVLGNAPKAAAGLSPISGCADVEALKAPTRLPQDLTIRTKVEVLRQRLSRVQALADSGKYEDATLEAQKVVQEAGPLRYRPLEAEALTSLGGVQNRRQLFKESVPTLQRAVTAALAGTHRDALVRAGLYLMTSFIPLGQFDAVWEWADFSQAGIEAMGGNVALEADLKRNMGRAYARLERLDESRQAAEEVLRLGTNPAVNRLTVAGAYNELGNVALESGQLRKAAEYFTQSLELTSRILGPSHPDGLRPLLNLTSTLQDLEGPSLRVEKNLKSALALIDLKWGKDSLPGLIARNNLSELEARRGHYKASEQIAEGALKGAQKLLGPTAIETAPYHRQLGDAHLGQRDFRAALGDYSKASELMAAHGSHEFDGVDIRVCQANALVGLGRRGEARTLYERAKETITQQHGAQSLQALGLQFGLGRWYLAGGQYREALELFRRQAELVSRLEDDIHPDTGLVHLGLGEAQLGLHDGAHAKASLSEAVQRLERGLAAPEYLGEARASLAKAVWAMSHDRRAVEPIVKAALDDYARSEANVVADVAALKLWARDLKD
jgi:tetratricopeptide (TPR) repeat protein